MDNLRSIFEKITEKAKYIANVAAHAADYAVTVEEPRPKAQRRLSRNSPTDGASRSGQRGRSDRARRVSPFRDA
jgi:hypothetical protein